MNMTRHLRRAAAVALVGDLLWTTFAAEALNPTGYDRSLGWVVWLPLQWALFGLFVHSTSPGTGVAAGLWSLAFGTLPSPLPSLPMAAFVVYALWLWRRQRAEIARTRPWEKRPRPRGDEAAPSPTSDPPVRE